MSEFLLTTPPGKGAIAVVTLFSENPARIIGEFFTPRSGKALDVYPPGSIVYGTIAEEDVLVCPIRQSEMEIHCHGSLAAVERLKEFLRARGTSEITQEEWLTRSVGERFQTENQRRAFLALSEAPTAKIASILWEQAEGAYERALETGQNTEIWDTLALHLTRPWKVVMAGRPNVGKSSLFNRILGFPRAIIYEKAGTTRDILREKTVLDGWMVELVDTAGLHLAEDKIEREGIRRAQAEIAQADLILWIREPAEYGVSEKTECKTESKMIDVSEMVGISVTVGISETSPFPAEKKVLTVWNKADLLTEETRTAVTSDENALAVSALHETGLDTLLNRIIRTLVPVEPPPGTGMKLT
ncbi:MAG: 50S ribosome-binding GTPase [Planctomycetia bacterium]|nr:50S ribosome-binding GTPase [Planctomycetia bacterium]